MGLENRKFSIVPAYARQCLCRPAPAFVVQDLVSSPVPNCFKASTFRPRILTILVPWRTLYAVLPRLTRGDLSKFRCLPPPGVPHHDSGISKSEMQTEPLRVFLSLQRWRRLHRASWDSAPENAHVPHPKERSRVPGGMLNSCPDGCRSMLTPRYRPGKPALVKNLTIHWSAIRYKKVYPSQIAVRLVKSVEHPHPSPPSRTARG